MGEDITAKYTYADQNKSAINSTKLLVRKCD